MPIDPAQYFESTTPPANLQRIEEQISSFIQSHQERPLVLVTSGGTSS